MPGLEASREVAMLLWIVLVLPSSAARGGRVEITNKEGRGGWDGIVR